MSFIGTQDNPVILTPEVSSPFVESNDVYSKRSKLLESTKLGLLEQNLENVNRAADESTYILNVISNPHLDVNAVKIALYLYAALPSAGDIFFVSQIDMDYFNLEHYGEGECLYLGVNNGCRSLDVYSFESITFLSTVLTEQLNITPSLPRLTGYLRILHSFSYLSITDINSHNTRNGLRMLKTQLKDKSITPDKCKNLTLGRSPLKHIRISNYMSKVNLSNKWVWADDVP
ncbi:hypothetical protein ACRN9L_12275 [Shewanella oncorhynchi]|uniref:hypothetical protein n=1 Tax=Shewanella oncorhynchi TaxID=2726434 RepID=UPI003D7BC2B9